MDPIWIGAASLVLAGLAYFAVVERGKRAERRQLARDAEREQRHLATAKVTRYVELAGSHPRTAAGLHALAMLGLHELDSDQRIRDAIEDMRIRLGGEDVNFAKKSVSDVLASMEDSDI